jgi:hypothetical protein
LPLRSAPFMVGNGIASNFRLVGSPPALRTDWRTVVSPMFFSVLTAMVLPTRSFGVRILLPSFTTIAEKSRPDRPVEATPLATALSGAPSDCAAISEVTLANPNWYLPASTPFTIGPPPCSWTRFRSMPRLLKKPFSLPR